MSFNSLTYLWFLPLVFVIYWAFGRTRRLQNFIIVAASFVFYGWWDWRFLILISITIMSCYITGISIDRSLSQEGGKRKAWWYSFANIVVNLAILFYFKYFNFFIESTQRVGELIGWHFDAIVLNVVLPVGISFYTFQAISYTVDVYKGRVKARNNLVLLSAYVSYFPQLVAGPIEKSVNLLPQFKKQRHFDVEMANDGMRQILWGFFMKLVISDNCALVTAPLLHGSTLDYSGLELFLMACCFMVQLYGDFAGYSDIAIGSSKLFGIRLTRNFATPPLSRNFNELWHRWHISLNNWFVDYVFRSLGGARSRWRIALNVIIVFAISGLWHGANMTYVCWGVVFGILTAISSVLRVGKKKNRRTPVAGYGRRLPSPREVFDIFTTQSITIVVLVLFASPSMGSALHYYADMLTRITWHSHHLSQFAPPLILYALLVVFEWTQRMNREHTFQLDFLPHRWQRYIVYYLLIITIGYFYVDTAQFMYFRF